MIRPQTLAASAIRGARVLNAAGENLGKIEELVIDLDTGHIAYAALSFGGILGLGDKLFAVPFAAMKLDEECQVFILDVDRDVLEKAPGFDKQNWPDVDLDYLDMLQTHYGVAAPIRRQR
jgi:sporulation protein YlmC with PRC-barrel domain